MGERGNGGPTGPRTIGGNDSAEQGEASTSTEERDRLAALEARIERLEAENDGQATTEGAERVGDQRAERVDALAEEVAALRETTERLESTLADAVDELDAIRDSEYGAIDEKRERQFESAVKSMVAFHQLATEVLDVRVENYEPSAGHADAERVAVTRERIADALDVGGGVDTGERIEMDDESSWPDPEEAARGGRVFGGDDGGLGAAEDSVDDADPTPESNAPDTGVYPPIGGEDESEAEADSAGDDDPVDVGALPQSVRPDIDDGGDPWRLTEVDPAAAREVREAIESSASEEESADPYPEGEAYARIVGETPGEQTDRSSSSGGAEASFVDERYPPIDDD